MKRIVVVAVMIVTVTVAACGPKGSRGPSGTPNPPFEGEKPQDAYVFQGEPGVYGGQMVLDLKGDPRTFNILLATDENTAFLLYYHIFRWLIDFRNGDNPPDYDSGLCTRYESSPDSKQWTFYLRRGVRWSDGEPFTADDVMFTYDVIRNVNATPVPDSTASAIADIFKLVDDEGKSYFPTLEKLDDYTVRFTMKSSSAMFLDQALNLFPIPKHKWESVWRAGKFTQVMKTTDDPKDVVGLGPFRIKEFVTGQRVVLERNPYFWKVDKQGQRLPYLDQLIFVIVPDFSTAQKQFQAGDLDALWRVRAEDYGAAQKMAGADVTVLDLGVVHDTQWMAFNLNNASNPKTGKPYVEPWKQHLFRDQRFRQAISYAIDREGLANTVYAGRAEPIYSFVTPADKYWYTDNVMKYPYDQARARQLLAEIGLKDGNGDGLLEDAEGHTVEFNITTNTQNSQRVKTVAFIAQNLQSIGIKANSTPVQQNVLIGLLQESYSFDAIVLGWQTGVPPGLVNVKNTLLSSGLNHICFASQPKPSTPWEARIDELVYEVETSPDATERKQKYAEIQRLWSEQLPEINLVAQKEAVAYKNKFGNLLPSTLPPRLTWNAEEIYIKK